MTLKTVATGIEPTKNKVVYGSKYGTVIQSVYIDKDSLGDTPTEAIQVVLMPQ